MSRGKWKGPYVKYELLQTINNSSLMFRDEIKTVSRNSLLLPKFIGLNLCIHNGKTYVTLKITNEMVNHKLGEFINTRKQFSYKKKKK